VHDVSQYAVDLQWGPVPSAGKEFVQEDSTALFTVNNALPSVKLISFNDRTEPFQIIARYANPALLPSGTDPVIGRYIISGMPKQQDGKKIPKIKVRVKLNLHGVLQVTSAQLLEEVEEVAPTPSPVPAAAAPAADATMSDVPPAAADAAKGDAMDTDEAKAAEAAKAPEAAPAAAAAASPTEKKKSQSKHLQA
jgi:heat shock protein 4